MTKRLNKEFRRYDDILPLVCASCGRRWDQMVRTEQPNVECTCGSSRVSVIPPAKLLDSNRANHYNRPVKSGRRGRRHEESCEPDRVLRAGVLEPESYDIEIIEEIG